MIILPSVFICGQKCWSTHIHASPLMSAQGSDPLIVNPNVYLNYLSSDEAWCLRVADSMNVGKALIWDILSSIPNDYKVIQTGRPSIVLFAYFSARPSVLVMLILAVLQMTGPVSTCTLNAMILVAFEVISSSAASFLFLKRIHAVYYGSKIIQYVFSFLWVVGIGTSCAVFSSTLHDYREIANTKHCVRYQGWSALSISFMDPVLFDTLVYFAIMYKILSAHRKGQKGSWRALFCGNGLPHLSRAVFQGGQQYYLITTGVNVTRLVFSAIPSASASLQVVLATPAVVLTSIMACRVHRNLLIEALDGARTDKRELTTPVFANGRVMSVSLPQEVKSDVIGQGEPKVCERV
ncbi:hypothetical protein EDC04DRAFT_527864 [Pisolithus marmoratus]|nr:hypothetical protein EDC04DRAFT_527864 [Pisolithus marmoratus]